MLARLLTLFFLFSGSAFAQTTSIRAGSLIDLATGTVAKGQLILIKDRKVVEIGPNVQLPNGTDVIDLSSSWVLPGLMDVHVHLTLGFPPREENDTP